jgi:hypothetical protein
MFLAIASNGSIAGWAIWNKYQMAWAFIVAASQFFNAIKGHLPFSKRLKALSALSNDLESLFLSMENHWFNVAEGRLNEEEIHKLQIKLKEQRRQILQKHIGPVDIPHDQKIMQRAVEVAKLYFENFYGNNQQ